MGDLAEALVPLNHATRMKLDTSVCAYSPRARPGATVSMPLDWSDLNASPDRWTLSTATKRLKRLRSDPSAKYWGCHQEISDASFAAVHGI
jgi:DNA primase